MEGTIRLLHCRYRLVRGAGVQGPGIAGLERSFQEEGLRAWEAALKEVLGEETGVCVLRNVKARATLNIAAMPRGELARQWGRRMAQAVVRTIASDPAGGNNLMRFENEAHYIACFLADLLRGTARQHWYYGIFYEFLDMEISQALSRLLQEHQALTGSVLANLYKQDALDLCLRRLDSPTLHWLWDKHLGRASGEGSESLMVEAALRLAERLGFTGPGLTVEVLQSMYRASVPPQTDWRERAGLSAGVMNALSFLVRQGYLRPPVMRDLEQLTSRLDAAFQGFDWLDVPILRSSLLRLFAQRQSGGLPVRPAPTGPNPRQLRLLDELQTLLQSKEVELDSAPRDAPANALRLYAALLSRSPGWADDPLAPQTIQQVLEAWTGHLTEIPGLGEAGRAVLAALKDEGSTVAVFDTVETNCAGIFLLLRALLDLRVPGLAPQAGHSSRAGALDLFLDLSRCWCGLPADSGDPGLSWIAELGRLDTDIESRTVDRTAAQRVQLALLEVLKSQRLVTSRVMHLYALPRMAGQTACIAGDESGAIWPLGGLITGPGAESEFLSHWLEAWKPQIVMADPAIATGPHFDQWRDDENLEREHTAGRASLEVALKALSPEREEPDLFILLTAAVLLRCWARWLRGFSASSVPYLLEHFIRRPGHLEHKADVLRVVLEPRPMDVVLEISGYLDQLPEVPWLGNRRVEFKIGGRL